MKDLATRTREFAVRVIRLYSALPKTTEAQVLGRQLLRSGTSVGAHYREASRARSDAEFISKIEGGLQELEESRYWFELLRDAGILSWERLADLDREADELTGTPRDVDCRHYALLKHRRCAAAPHARSASRRLAPARGAPPGSRPSSSLVGAPLLE